MTVIYLVRHSDKQDNSGADLPENRSNIGLTDEGKTKAMTLAGFFKRHKITHIHESDYLRAKQTAAYAADELSIKPVEDERFGEFVLSKKRIADPDQANDIFQRAQGDWSFIAGDGESIDEAIKRFTNGIKDILSKTPEGVHAVFTHGRVMQSYLYSITHLKQFKQSKLVIQPCDVYRIEFSEDSTQINCRLATRFIDRNMWQQIIPTTANTLVAKYDSSTIHKAHIFEDQQYYNAQATTYEYHSLRWMQDLKIRVPSKIKLIEDNCLLSMEYIDATCMSDTPLEDELMYRAGKQLHDTHHTFSQSSKPRNFTISQPDHSLNAQCALNFSYMTKRWLDNDLREKIAQDELSTQFLHWVEKASDILTNNPSYLSSIDIIHGDFKPDNLLIHADNSLTCIDPLLTYGRLSCDIGKMLARAILLEPHRADSIVISFLKGYGTLTNSERREIAHMIVFDTLNTYSRILAKKTVSTTNSVSIQKTKMNIGYVLNNVLPEIMKIVGCDTNIFILRHLDDIIDYRVPQRNTSLKDNETKKAPFIANQINELYKDSGFSSIRIITSSQLRATQTAEAVSDALRIRGHARISLNVDPRITDLAHGRYVVGSDYSEGEDIPARRLAEKAFNNASFTHNNIDYRHGDSLPTPTGHTYSHLVNLFTLPGESQREFSKRFYNFMHEIITDANNDPSVMYIVVTHTAVVFRSFELMHLLAEDVESIQPGNLISLEWAAARYLPHSKEKLFVYPGELKTLDYSSIYKNLHILRDEMTAL